MRRLFLALLCLGASASSGFAADLVVTVTGVTPDRGDVRVVVIADPDGMARQDASRNLKAATAQNNVITTRFIGLAPGPYGVVALSDRHVNHSLERAIGGKNDASSPNSGEIRVTLAEPATPVTLALH